MKYSIVNGERKEAFPKGNGFCECCNKSTIAKCGSKIMHPDGADLQSVPLLKYHKKDEQ